MCVFISGDKIRERNFGETFYGPETQLNAFMCARAKRREKMCYFLLYRLYTSIMSALCMCIYVYIIPVIHDVVVAILTLLSAAQYIISSKCTYSTVDNYI